jgi:hypothetical protein
MDGIVLEDLHREDKILDKKGDKYSVNSKFFEVLEKYIKKPEKVKTFQELDEAEKVTTEELIATFRDYAVETGGEISPRVVKSLIYRVRPNKKALRVLFGLARTRANREFNTGKHKTAEEYKEVADVLNSIIMYR